MPPPPPCPVDPLDPFGILLAARAAAGGTAFGLASRNITSAGDQYLSVADDDVFSFGNGSTDSPFSIAFWCKLPSGGQITLGRYLNTSPFFGEYSIRVNRAGALFLQTLDGTSTIRCRQDSTAASTDGAWHHIAATYDASGVDEGITLYEDGSALASTGFGQDGSYVAMENYAQALTIGQVLMDSAFITKSDGQIADVRIYDYELSAAQVAALADTSTATNPTPGPIGWWIGDADSLADLSGNGHNATEAGTTDTTYSTDGPFD